MKIMASILALLLAAGCASYRPYTPREKTLMGAAITANAANVLSSSYAFSRGLDEGNGLLWGDNNDSRLMAALSMKIVWIGSAYLIGQAWPDTREWLWGGAAAAGALATGWDLYQIGTAP